MTSAELKKESLALTAVIVAPMALLTNLLVSFVLAPWVCANHWEPALFAVNAVFLLIAAGAGWMGWQRWDEAGREWPGESPNAPARSRFLAVVALVVSGICCLQIVGMIIVAAVVGPCR